MDEAADLAARLDGLVFADLTTDQVTARIIDEVVAWRRGHGWRVYRRGGGGGAGTVGGSPGGRRASSRCRRRWNSSTRCSTWALPGRTGHRWPSRSTTPT